MIHPTAIVHPAAELDPSVDVGPFCVIESGVMIGAGCKLGPHVHVLGPTSIGRDNRFHTGCVIGDAPQDLKYKGQPTRLVIGDDNVFREYFTAHRSNSESEDTTIGSHNLFMSGSHVGHNCHVGNNVVFANGVLAAGHVTVEDRAFLSGSCLVHQFARVGTLAMMQGGSAISQDLPPFWIVQGAINVVIGVNVVGMRRAGVPHDEIQAVRTAYKLINRSGLTIPQALERIEAELGALPATRQLVDFIRSAKRGVCTAIHKRDPHHDD